MDKIHAPQGWKKVRIDEIAQVSRGASPRPIDDPKWFSDKGAGWIRIEDVTRSKKYIRKTKQYLSKEGIKKSVSVNNGDLIMSICGTIGRPMILEMQACIHDGFVVFRNFRDKIDTVYFYYCLQHLETTFAGQGQPGTQKNLNTSIVGATEILLPPMPEQKKIAEILTTVDEDIDQTDRIIEDCERIVKGLMQTMLIKGIPGKHKKYKVTEIGEIPEEWDLKNLEEIGEFLKGKGISKSTLLEKGIPCVRYGELYTVHHFVIKKFYSFIDQKTASESEPLKNSDLLLAGSGETAEEIGKCAVYLGNEEAYAGGDVVIFRDHHQDGLFMSYLLNSTIVRRQLYKLGQGYAVVHIYPYHLSGVMVPLPPLNEQREISATFSTIAKRVEKEIERKASLVTIKKSLMQKLLSGEMPVKVNKNE